MKKDQVLILGDLLLRQARSLFPDMREDGKLYHQEVYGINQWTQRLTLPHWPHVGHGEAVLPCPGIRLEIWYSQKPLIETSKPNDVEEVALAVLMSPHPTLSLLQKPMERLIKGWINDGRFAKRYLPLDALASAIAPDSIGVYRWAPVTEEKLSKAFALFLKDTVSYFNQMLADADPESLLAAQFLSASQSRDLFAELKSKLGR